MVGQQRHEYDEFEQALCIRAPLKEVGGVAKKYGTIAQEAAPPARTRWVHLSPSIATFYELLLDNHQYPFVFTMPEVTRGAGPIFGSGFGDLSGMASIQTNPMANDHSPAILPWFTFHEGRHTHSTWLTEDGVPEVARQTRLGQKMKGIARIYDHVTDAMRQQITDALEARWAASLLTLTGPERDQLVSCSRT